MHELFVLTAEQPFTHFTGYSEFSRGADSHQCLHIRQPLQWTFTTIPATTAIKGLHAFKPS